MNSTPRTATRGGTKTKSESGSGKGHKSDSKRDGPKNNDSSKAQSSSERIARITESVTDEFSLKQSIALIMGLIPTHSEDEVVTALHDCDNDVNKAVSMLLEGEAQGEWETSGKKKKNRQASASKGGDGGSGRGQAEADGEDGDAQPLAANQDRDRSRGRGGGAPRLRGRGGNDNRGPGRGRENNKENEGAGGEDGFRGPRVERGDRGEGFRRGGRGMSNGPGGRGGRGGRGGGGRLGSRTFQGRDGREGREGRDRSDGDRFPSTIDTWNPTNSQDTNDKPLKMETWGDNFPAPEDWDNEEYTGSLADSKVFTPSALETSVVAPEPLEDTSNQDLLSMATSTGQDFRQSNALPSSPLPVGVGTLNPAQAQYLTQLTQQSAENLKASAVAAATVYGQTESLKSAVGIGSSASYAQSAGYGSAGTYGQTYAPTSYGTPAASYSTSAGYATNASAANAYSAGSGSFPAASQSYQSSNNSSFGVYPSSGGNYATQGYSASTVSYDGTNSTSDGSVPTAQPARAKTQRPRVPPPSKIPSSAVEMPEDPISSSVSSLDVQFGCLEFGSDGATFDTGAEQGSQFAQPAAPASSAVTDSVPSAGLDTSVSQQTSLNAYSATKNAAAAAVASNPQAALVGALSGKGLSSNEGLSIQSTDHKSSYNSQPARAVSSTSGLDLTKSDVGALSYASAPSAGNYAYQNQKSTSSVYQPASYSTGSYTAPQTTFANAVPSSYSTTAYNSQPSVNNSFPNTSYGSQPPATNYAASGATYPSANSFQNTSQNYQSGAGGYGTALSSGYSAASAYQNSYAASSVASTKLNSGLSTTKESQEYMSSTTSNIASTASTTSSLLTSASTPQAVSTAASKISTGAMKSNVVPSLHPQMMSAQYIMSNASVPFYHQTPMYAYDDVQVQLQRIPMQPTGYYDMGYTAPTSLATGRDSLPNVAYTVADARYSGRNDNNASPVPSTLSQQQTATAAHQQPMMNHLPPGYTYVYNAVPSNFQYSAPIFPVQSGGNAHGASNQYGKPGSYGSAYGTAYDGLNQTADYNKSAYVSGGVKSGVGGTSVSSATSATDLYGKAHTALGKVNSYDKQGFHSATPPPFNLAAGQGTGMSASGAYAPQLYIPAIPPHPQHHSAALMTSHLQDSSNSSGQRSQSAAQPSKSGNKQNYNTYWPGN